MEATLISYLRIDFRIILVSEVGSLTNRQTSSLGGGGFVQSGEQLTRCGTAHGESNENPLFVRVRIPEYGPHIWPATRVRNGNRLLTDNLMCFALLLIGRPRDCSRTWTGTTGNRMKWFRWRERIAVRKRIRLLEDEQQQNWVRADLNAVEGPSGPLLTATFEKLRTPASSMSRWYPTTPFVRSNSGAGIRSSPGKT